jgi:hypothetical protein
MSSATIEHSLSGQFGHGKVDPAIAGRLGGIASGLSRRARETQAIEERIIEKGGMAAFKVLELRLRRQQDLEAARIEADHQVRRARGELEALVQVQERELRRLQSLRVEADECDAAIAAKEEKLEELEALGAELLDHLSRHGVKAPT